MSDSIMTPVPRTMVDVIVESIPGSITNSERAGQARFVAAQQLPREMRPASARAYLESVGFRFGENVDELFVACAFPEGWKLKATDQAIYSDLFDAKDRRRALIFYKAAFYDQRAEFALLQRFTVNSYVEVGPKTMEVVVRDGDQIIERFGTWEHAGDRGREALRKSLEHQTSLEEKAAAWLNERWPKWDDPTAYWD